MQNKKPSVGGVWIFSGTTQCEIWALFQTTQRQLASRTDIPFNIQSDKFLSAPIYYKQSSFFVVATLVIQN